MQIFLALLFSILIFGGNAFSEETLLTEEGFQTKEVSPIIPPKIIPSEHYPSWEKSFNENFLCYKGDCGYEQRGPLFFILEGQRNITYAL
ncbi:MAG: hypothetical protein EOM19_04680 [Candidatus Moranbacteria bacterium]|nr:hypothetical protein [Candidatus Moranbacteria bacterium]